MSGPVLPVPQEPAIAGITQARDPVDSEARQLALRQHHQERLARLFRRVGNSADERYLFDVMGRYRGIEPP